VPSSKIPSLHLIVGGTEDSIGKDAYEEPAHGFGQLAGCAAFLVRRGVFEIQRSSGSGG